MFDGRCPLSVSTGEGCCSLSSPVTVSQRRVSASPVWRSPRRKRQTRRSSTYRVPVRSGGDEDLRQDARKQLQWSTSSLPWALGGIESVTKHVNSVNERILWGMVATSLGMSDESIAARLKQLEALMPGCRQYLSRNKVPVLAQLIQLDGSLLAMRLLDLRSALPPGTDAAKVAASRPELLLQSGVSAAVERAVEALKRLLPQAGRDGRKSLSDILNAEPDFLDTKKVEIALAELSRLKPQSEAGELLLQDTRLLSTSQPPQKRRDPNDEYYI